MASTPERVHHRGNIFVMGGFSFDQNQGLPPWKLSWFVLKSLHNADIWLAKEPTHTSDYTFQIPDSLFPSIKKVEKENKKLSIVSSFDVAIIINSFKSETESTKLDAQFINIWISWRISNKNVNHLKLIAALTTTNKNLNFRVCNIKITKTCIFNLKYTGFDIFLKSVTHYTLQITDYQHRCLTVQGLMASILPPCRPCCLHRSWHNGCQRGTASARHHHGRAVTSTAGGCWWGRCRRSLPSCPPRSRTGNWFYEVWVKVDHYSLYWCLYTSIFPRQRS